MKTISALHKILDKDVEDWFVRQVLADALLDAGDQTGAATQLWMVGHERAPMRIRQITLRTTRWLWYRALDNIHKSELPAHIFNELHRYHGEGSFEFFSYIVRSYAKRQFAEKALEIALVQLGELDVR